MQSNDYGLSPLHQKLKEMLVDIDAFCKRNAIPFFLSDGCVLGAVRHRGFIPWDDDCDINIYQEDYMKFYQLAKEQLSEKYLIDAPWDNPRLKIPLMKLKAKNTTFVGKDYLFDNEIAHNIFIDIFPLYAVPNDHKERIRQRRNCIINSLLVREEKANHKSTDWMIKGLSLLLGKERLKRLTYRKLSQYDRASCSCISPIQSMANYWDYLFPKEVFGTPRYIPFEDIEVPVPEKTEEYLQILYGDYMRLPSEEERLHAQHALLIDPEHDYQEHLSDITTLREKACM